MNSRHWLFPLLLVFAASGTALGQSEPFLLGQSKPRQITYENPSGAPGQAAKENEGAKGHAWDTVKAGTSVTMADYKGTGIIRHIWLTIPDQSPAQLRSLRFDIYWDGAAKPAVSAPLGDFFGMPLSHKLPFENAYFSNPEGRSFNCTIPMPFRHGFRVVLTNESNENVALYYSIMLTEVRSLPASAGYLHAYWRRIERTELGADYEVLPKVEGKGRFLGSNIGVLTDPAYKDSWFGEGEVKMYLDGDGRFPTLAGTGAEDYIGTAWGEGPFTHRSSGCTIADSKEGKFAFYKFHDVDPIEFQKECRVTIQVIGGASIKLMLELEKEGAKFKPVSASGNDGKFLKLLDMNPSPSLEELSHTMEFVNFYREDDYSSTAYFYLDKPESNLPALQPVGVRTAKM